MLILKILMGLLASMLVLLGLGWLGLQVDAKSFEPPKANPTNYGRIPAPSDLPAPVARYVQVAFGDSIPVIKSAVVIGKAEITINGITMPARFKFYHQAGQSYYHLIQTTWFTIPFLNVHERNLNGETILNLPGQQVKNEAKINAAANQGLWAESIWLPSIWFTDERIRWEAIDNNTALLIIPNASEDEMLTVHFDPQTGLISEFTALRYRDKTDESHRQWLTKSWNWQSQNGIQIPMDANIQWDDDAPWVEWHIEKIIYNIDISSRLAQFGGEVED